MILRRHGCLDRLRREQDGIAMVVAIGVLSVTMMLAVVALSASTHLTQSTVRDGNTKRALAAAQAGLDVALYRLVRVGSTPSGSFSVNCVTTAEVAWSSAAPHCQGATSSLGNGASYTYWVTPDLSSAGLAGLSQVKTECGSATVVAGERCITATGTVNGVTRRAQIRVAGVPLFPVAGIVGFKGVLIDSSQNWSGPNFQITSDTGSNGPITFGQNVNAPLLPYHCYIGPGGSSPCGGTQQSVPTLTAASVDILPFAGTAVANQNSTIAAGYTAATRTLSVTGTTTLAAGDYNFCSVKVANGATLAAAAGARVRIYVDSAARAGSGCSGVASQGTFVAAQSSLLNAGSTGTLETYLYGTNVPAPPYTPPPPATCNNDFSYYHGSTTATSGVFVYAPNSNVTITANGKITGAVVGCRVTFLALTSTARFDSPPGRPSASSGIETGTWRECTAQYTGNPESGCNG
jgi:Tfp pilus assembly protein PilX